MKSNVGIFDLEEKTTTESGGTPHVIGTKMILKELSGLQFDVKTLISLHFGQRGHFHCTK